MKMLGFLLVLLVLAGPLIAASAPPVRMDEDESEKDNAKTRFLKQVASSLAEGSASGITSYFPKKGKIELRLRGVRNGKYRDEQARSLIATWLSGMEGRKAKLLGVRGTVGRIRLDYRDREKGTTVESTIVITFDKEGESWLITGVAES